MTERWQRGDLGVLRELHRGRVWSCRPGHVASDEGTRAAFYFPAGTRCLWPNDGRRSLRIPQESWQLVLGGWLPYDQLHIIELGAIHHATVLWHPHNREPAGWKVDFHEPAVRTRLGFDALDWALDVMVSVDGRYHLKDEDELAELQQRGLLTPERVAQIEAELERVLERVKAKASPFDHAAFAFRPDPSWTPARCPNGWDEV